MKIFQQPIFQIVICIMVGMYIWHGVRALNGFLPMLEIFNLDTVDMAGLCFGAAASLALALLVFSRRN